MKQNSILVQKTSRVNDDIHGIDIDGQYPCNTKKCLKNKCNTKCPILIRSAGER